MITAIIAIIQIFCSTWSSILLTITPGVITYKRFALIVAIVSAIIILKLIKDAGWKLPKRTAAIFVLYFFMVVAYLITPYFYHDVSNPRYESFKLALIGQIFPSVLTASLISYRNDIQLKIKKITPYAGLLFAIIAFITSRFPNMQTTGGYAESSNGLNYQSIAYAAAFAAGLAEASLVANESEKKGKLLTLINYLTVAISLVAILLAGGRGGFVLFVFFSIFTLIVTRKSISISGLIKFALIMFIIIAGGYLAFRYAINSNVATSGLERINGLLSGEGDTGRTNLHMQAITIFKTSPVFGHGLGSVFYEMSLYSHNIFTDSLVETGVFGTGILIILLIVGIIKGVKLFREDRTNIIWLYVFFCGFIEGMFSGYYLTQIPMYWALFFILSKPSSASSASTEYDTNVDMDIYNG